MEFSLTPITRVAAAYASVVNALHIGALKKIGILKEGILSFEETLGSSEEFNKRLDTGKNLPFLFRIEARGDLIGLLDPTNETHFLTWEIADGSYVTLPGIAESAPIIRGFIKIHLFERVEYSFEFNGHDGRPFSYLGEKNLKPPHLLKGLTTLAGVVRDTKSGEIILESTVFSGQSLGVSSLLSLIRSARVA